MRVGAVLGAALFVAWTTLAPDAGATNCVPGAQQQCACAGGGSSAQVCSDDGSRFGPCQCVAPAAQPAQAAVTRAEPAEPRTKRRSGGLFVTGLVLTIVGGLVVSGGAVGAVACSKDHLGCPETPLLFSGLGAAVAAGGVTFMIIGGTHVPDDGTGQISPWWKPTTVAVSPAGARATWTF